MEDAQRLLTPAEVATLFRVDPKTVNRWAATGRLASIRTPGGRARRFRETDVNELLNPPAENRTASACHRRGR
ncbi:MAG: BldC family transcriptional regulator [Streptosporangiales bacterium]|nr:BldC family transcriptional regulator [Streptosporangiales bacterium]